MGLSSVAGVFSRYFIVGFFLPAFFVLVALGQALDASFQPDVYADASAGTEIAILGGAALLVGLLLVGLHYPVLRMFEGYPIRNYGARFPLKTMHNFMVGRQRKCFSNMNESEDFTGQWRFDRHFATDDASLILPTAFGNAIRAFERHSFIRWHLNGIGAWPYVESLLSAQEAQVLSDAKGDVAFFINVSALSMLSAAAIAADRLVNDAALSVLLCLIPLAVSAVAYRWAIGAAISWGEVVRASIDLHRRELYTRLGIRTPRNFADERQIAWRINAALLTGKPLPDDLADVPTPGQNRVVVNLELPHTHDKEAQGAD